MSPDAAIAIFPAVGRIAAQRLADLDAIEAMTEEMMARVAAGDWEALPELQRERDLALRACFAAPLTEADSATAVARIQHLLKQNEALVAEVTKAKRTLAQDMQRSRRDVKAVSSYLSVGG